MVMDFDQIFECSKQFANVQTFAQMFDLLEKIGFKIYRKFAYVDKEPKTVEGFYWRLAIFNNRNLFQTGFDLIDGGFVQMYGKRYRINSPNLLVCITRLCDVGSLDFDPSNYYTTAQTQAYVTGYTYDKATIDQKVQDSGTFDPTQYYTTAQTYSKSEVDTALNGKQATLVSGTNIKTVGTNSLLGSGNIALMTASIGTGNDSETLIFDFA